VQAETVRALKIGFVGLGSVKHDEMHHHYTRVLGLAVAADTGRDRYYTCGNDHHAVALFRADTPGQRHVGLQIAGEGPFTDTLKSLQAMGIAASLQSDPFAGIGSAIKLADPDGYTVYLYRETTAPKSAYGNVGGIAPSKLGHLAMHASDARQSMEFFTRVLGFRWSDWMADFFVFLRCNSDHHTLNFMTSPRRGMFHFAFEALDATHIARTCDVLGVNRIPLIWGPGRHGVGHNIFTYHHDPDGNIVEVYAEMDRMVDERLGYFDPRPYHQDYPQRPKVWPRDPMAANMWGIMPPPGFEA
jgi:catechol-2,3-dioxygenase